MGPFMFVEGNSGHVRDVRAWIWDRDRFRHSGRPRMNLASRPGL
jgi:hypothetical protein